jgi:hypothetical protein
MDNFFCDYQEFSDLDARRSIYYGPMMWYMNTLTEIGFTDIINTSMMFTTIYARK